MIAAGFGCRACCSAADLRAALELSLRDNGVALSQVGGFFGAELAAPPALHEAARALGKPLLLLPRSALAATAAAALTRSARVLARLGLPSIAETAALAGALELGSCGSGGCGSGGCDSGSRGSGRSARLLSPRVASGAATCALARLMEEP